MEQYRTGARWNGKLGRREVFCLMILNHHPYGVKRIKLSPASEVDVKDDHVSWLVPGCSLNLSRSLPRLLTP